MSDNDITMFHGDCLTVMDRLIKQGIIVDSVITDPPYGTTACKWDSIIPLSDMWDRINALIKPTGAVVLFGSEPFSSHLRLSNLKNYKYDWVWEKAVGSNFAVLKYQPMKEHEIISVFSTKTHQYYPIKQPRKGKGSERYKYKNNGSITGQANGKMSFKGWTVDNCPYDPNLRNPSSVQYFNNRTKNRGLHPTQKPVLLMEYLIKTYTKQGEIVLDFTMGSGTTAVACKNLKRKFIGIEKEKKYYDIAKSRI